MTKLIILFLTFTFFSCTGNQVSDSSSINDSFQTDTSLIINSETDNNFPKKDSSNNLDIIDIDSIQINDKMSFKTTTKILKRYLNVPDSVVTDTFVCVDYFNTGKSTNYYYGNSIFETLNDTAVIRKIDFRSGRFKLKTNKILLDNKTTLSDFELIYPNAVQQANDWTDVIEKKTYRLVNVLPKKDSYDQWILKFDNGKLVEIEYWIPC